MNNSSHVEPALFKQRLAETILWCGQRASLHDPKNSLRTLDFDLSDEDKWLSHTERVKLTDSILTRRAELLNPKEVVMYQSEELFKTGRLLLFDPDATLSDGAAELESKGFFDADNTPAWDTWVYYDIDRNSSSEQFFFCFLISWIPPQFIELVNAGIEVNPEGCIRWASDINMAFTRMLKAERLI